MAGVGTFSAVASADASSGFGMAKEADAGLTMYLDYLYLNVAEELNPPLLVSLSGGENGSEVLIGQYQVGKVERGISGTLTGLTGLGTGSFLGAVDGGEDVQIIPLNGFPVGPGTAIRVILESPITSGPTVNGVLMGRISATPPGSLAPLVAGGAVAASITGTVDATLTGPVGIDPAENTVKIIPG